MTLIIKSRGLIFKILAFLFFMVEKDIGLGIRDHYYFQVTCANTDIKYGLNYF
jgi:hypothetical protein